MMNKLEKDEAKQNGFPSNLSLNVLINYSLEMLNKKVHFYIIATNLIFDLSDTEFT